MTTSISIRPALPQDVHRIHAFISELEECQFEFERFEKYYHHNIAHPDNIYLVAVDEHSEVIGYLSCHGQLLLHHLGKVYEIQEMFVEAKYRGQGIGALLIRALEEKLQQENVRSLEVTTNKNRTATQEFYKRNGFAQTHVKFTKILTITHG